MLRDLKNIQVHSHKVYGSGGVCYDPHVSERETEAQGRCNAIPSRSWNLQMVEQGWHPYLSPLDSFPLQLFPQGWGTSQWSILETAWNQSCCTRNPVFCLTLTHIWWNRVGLHCKEASKLPFTKPEGSRRPELAERFNLGIFLLHKISFRTFGPLGLPQIAND